MCIADTMDEGESTPNHDYTNIKIDSSEGIDLKDSKQEPNVAHARSNVASLQQVRTG